MPTLPAPPPHPTWATAVQISHKVGLSTFVLFLSLSKVYLPWA